MRTARVHRVSTLAGRLRTGVAVAAACAAASAVLASGAIGLPETGAAATTASGVRAANVGAQVPVAISRTASGTGLVIASTDGSVTPEGTATNVGDVSHVNLNDPVVGVVTTPAEGGYWLLGADGGVFSEGTATFHGSTGNIVLAQPALAMAPTPTGQGYWVVARDGGVFTFGDAPFRGSTGDVRLAQPVDGMAATPSGQGYWLVARDGGIFTFGDAPFAGSAGNVRLAAPVAGMAATPSGHGYWMLGRDGGVFSYGDAGFFGSPSGAGRPSAPAISMAATRDGRGYWVLLADGRILPYGDAAAVPTSTVPSSGSSLVGQIVTVDPGHDGGNGANPGYINHPVPAGPGQVKACDTVGSQTPGGYPEHAFNFDVAGRLAADLRSRGATVVLTRSNDSGLGPCVDQRAAIGNQAHSDAAVSVHADGGPPGGRGFAILEPALYPGYNDAVVPPSDALGTDLRNAYAAGTPMPLSTYDGSNGIAVRGDLGGLNLSTVPKVFIECGNMQNGTDAGLIENAGFRQQAADSLLAGFTTYLLPY